VPVPDGPQRHLLGVDRQCNWPQLQDGAQLWELAILPGAEEGQAVAKAFLFLGTLQQGDAGRGSK